MDCLEAEDGEDDGAGVDGGEGVGGGDDQNIPHAVLLRVVVGTETDDGAECQAERIKNLVTWYFKCSWFS